MPHCFDLPTQNVVKAILLQFLPPPPPPHTHTPPPNSPYHNVGTACPNLWPYTHPLLPELRECVHNDTKHNVQSNSGHNDEERDVIEQPQPSHTPIFWDKWNYLQGEYYSFTLECHNAIHRSRNFHQEHHFSSWTLGGTN